MPRDRTAWRNVFFRDASTQKILGGFFQKGSVPDSTLLWILGSVLLIVEGEFSLKHVESGRAVVPSSSPVELGTYDIYSSSQIKISDEPWFSRIISHSVTGGENAFRDGVRARDNKCVVTGVENEMAEFDDYAGFQSAHIFPLEKESLWIQLNYGRWISNMEAGPGISKINSIQNGILILPHIHLMLDQYTLSINPDDGYRIHTFVRNAHNVDGRVLDFVCRDPANPNRVSDELLRWHFRQTVLANMRGAGEPIFETDFPPGTDQMATLRVEPYGKERLEMELERRLGAAPANDKGKAY